MMCYLTHWNTAVVFNISHTLLYPNTKVPGLKNIKLIILNDWYELSLTKRTRLLKLTWSTHHIEDCVGVTETLRPLTVVQYCYRVMLRLPPKQSLAEQQTDTALQEAHKPDNSQVLFWRATKLLTELPLISTSWPAAGDVCHFNL